jgi:hypothetical protein
MQNDTIQEHRDNFQEALDAGEGHVEALLTLVESEAQGINHHLNNGDVDTHTRTEISLHLAHINSATAKMKEAIGVEPGEPKSKPRAKHGKGKARD